MFWYAAAAVLAAYLIGSINFAVIFGTIFLKKDVRKMGSGNAGTTNVMRNAGFLPGALTFVFDALKGFAATYTGEAVFEYIYAAEEAVWALPVYGAYICGLACMLGHVFPVFFQFRGGKGVATSVGIFAVCSPIAIVTGLIVFAVVTAASRIVSLSSLVATLTVVTCSIIFADSNASVTVQAVLAVIMGIIVILKHGENIKRLIAGTESRIGRKKK